MAGCEGNMMVPSEYITLVLGGNRVVPSEDIPHIKVGINYGGAK